MANELTCIKTYLTRAEADLACNLLRSEGIEAMVVADDCGGMRPQFGYGTGVKLFVRAADAAQALDILGQDS